MNEETSVAAYVVAYVRAWGCDPKPKIPEGFNVDHLYYLDRRKGWFYLTRAGRVLREENLEFCEKLEEILNTEIAEWSQREVERILS